MENRLQPSRSANPHHRDLVVALGLVVLVGCMLPELPRAVWYLLTDFLGVGEGGDGPVTYNVIGEMMTANLLVAMGLLVCLRRGIVDLSVWFSAALSAAVAAILINSGKNPALAMAAGAACGLGVGLINGALVAFARIPAPAATLLVALLGCWAMFSATTAPEVRIADQTFAAWQLTQDPQSDGDDEDAHEMIRQAPLVNTRKLMVILAYGLAMTVMMAGGWPRQSVQSDNPMLGPEHPTPSLGHCRLLPGHGPPIGRTALMTTLAGAGLLAGAGGAIRLLDQTIITLHPHVIGDMRIISTVVLAGGLLLCGPWRTLMAGVFLPAALLVSTNWQVRITPIHWEGYELHVLLLACMAYIAHRAGVHAMEDKGQRIAWRLPPAILTSAGILTAALSFIPETFRVKDPMMLAGVGAWLLGAALLGASHLWNRRRTA